MSFVRCLLVVGLIRCCCLVYTESATLRRYKGQIKDEEEDELDETVFNDIEDRDLFDARERALRNYEDNEDEDVDHTDEKEDDDDDGDEDDDDVKTKDDDDDDVVADSLVARKRGAEDASTSVITRELIHSIVEKIYARVLNGSTSPPPTTTPTATTTVSAKKGGKKGKKP